MSNQAMPYARSPSLRESFCASPIPAPPALPALWPPLPAPADHAAIASCFFG